MGQKVKTTKKIAFEFIILFILMSLLPLLFLADWITHGFQRILDYLEIKDDV